MSFVIDTDTCSAHLKGSPKLFNRFLQYTGGLYISALSVAELFAWVDRSHASPRLREGLLEMLGDFQVIPLDFGLAQFAGTLRASLLDQGIVVPHTDLLIGATALHSNFTLVSHNTKHFRLIPNLRLQDWCA